MNVCAYICSHAQAMQEVPASAAAAVRRPNVTFSNYAERRTFTAKELRSTDQRQDGLP